MSVNFNINSNGFELIGLDITKLILNNLNKHYVIAFLKSSKLLYYNKSLRTYVMNRFKKCTHICDYCTTIKKYNIEQKYKVSLCLDMTKPRSVIFDFVFTEFDCDCKPCNKMICVIGYTCYNELKIISKLPNKLIFVNYLIEHYKLLNIIYYNFYKAFNSSNVSYNALYNFIAEIKFLFNRKNFLLKQQSFNIPVNT